MKQNDFPLDWNEERVQQVLRHYEEQTDEEAVLEDEELFGKQDQTIMKIPLDLVPAVRELLAKYSRGNRVAA